MRERREERAVTFTVHAPADSNRLRFLYTDASVNVSVTQFISFISSFRLIFIAQKWQEILEDFWF